MEIFKTEILKKNWKIAKGRLSQNIKVRLLSKTQKFIVSCKYCKETFCKACHSFNIAKETLLKGLDPIGKEYIENFIKDSLCISSETLQTNYQVSNSSCTNRKDL